MKPKFCPARAAAGCGQRLEVEFKVSQGGWEDEGSPLRVFISRWVFISWGGSWGGTRSLGSVSLGVIMSAASSFAVELIVAIELVVAIGFAVANLKLGGLISVSYRPVEDGFL